MGGPGPVLSFAAAQREYNGLTWWTGGVLGVMAERPFADYTLQAGDVTITQTVETRGYEASSSGILYSWEDGVTPYYHLVFTLELAK